MAVKNKMCAGVIVSGSPGSDPWSNFNVTAFCWKCVGLVPMSTNRCAPWVISFLWRVLYLNLRGNLNLNHCIVHKSLPFRISLMKVWSIVIHLFHWSFLFSVCVSQLDETIVVALLSKHTPACFRCHRKVLEIQTPRTFSALWWGIPVYCRSTIARGGEPTHQHTHAGTQL